MNEGENMAARSGKAFWKPKSTSQIDTKTNLFLRNTPEWIAIYKDMCIVFI